VSPDHPLSFLTEVLGRLREWLAHDKVPGVVIGGVAASFLGRPRMTRDVGVLVLLDENSWPHFLESGSEYGFVPRLSDCLEFARQARVLLVRDQSTSVDVDMVFAGLPFEEDLISRARTVELGGVPIRLPSPEDFIVMKSVAHRPRDMEDIRAVIEAHPDLDRNRVHQWLRSFSEALEAPEILDDVLRILGVEDSGR
jgi:predicted nucleotidyltransferase